MPRSIRVKELGRRRVSGAGMLVARLQGESYLNCAATQTLVNAAAHVDRAAMG